MSELRRDPTRDEWVLVAPGRAARPHAPDAAGLSTTVASVCPFCPGHEERTPIETVRLPATGPWQVRVVGNRYPLVSEGGATPPTVGYPFGIADGWGRHDVLVESRDHYWDLRTGSAEDITLVMEAAYVRYTTLLREEPGAVLLFRNHGAASGTSLEHPHSQILSLAVPTPRLTRRWRIAEEYFSRHGMGIHDTVLAAEIDDGRRILSEDQHCVAFVPFAPSAPFEVWIMPRWPETDFATSGAASRSAVARALGAVTAALDDVLGDPAYNMVLVSGPPAVARTEEWFRWHMKILPRISRRGGLELGTGLDVTTRLPEDCAGLLRAALPV
jgi:UDPglucose--hexose-1-phosphate uridylyltransferase